jgi:hypothetical protein
VPGVLKNDGKVGATFTAQAVRRDGCLVSICQRCQTVTTPPQDNRSIPSVCPEDASPFPRVCSERETKQENDEGPYFTVAHRGVRCGSHPSIMVDGARTFDLKKQRRR